MDTSLLRWSTPSPAPHQKAAADNSMRTTIVEILFSLANLRIAHWQASTKTNEHRALGDLYEALDGLVDDFTEVLMGFEGSRDMPSTSAKISGGNGYEAIVDSLKTATETLCTASKSAGADDLANIAADMKQAVNKAKYLLS
jgi:hypothetical protein